VPEHAHDSPRPDTGGLRTPPVEDWDSWPFVGTVTPKTLRPPEPEPDRDGEGVRPCAACSKGDDAYIWTDELLAEMGIMLARVERAVLAVECVERVHILRYGEGSAHLHWWFMARQTGVRQTASGFAMIWDDVLPPTPEDVHRASIETVVAAMNR